MTSPALTVTVGWLVRTRTEAFNLGFETLAGASGMERTIANPYVLKTGLALAGFDAYLQDGRVVVFGASEVGYLDSLDPAARRASLARVFRHGIPCVLVTDGLVVPPEVPDEADRAGVPVLRTALATPIAIAKLTSFLEDRLAERTLLHAVLMDILGLGVVIVGESGIGKSECALDLVLRGHRLVADDTVELRRRAESVLIGTCPELTRHHMEIRGLGVINVKDLFGVASTRTSKRVELVVQLERWEAGRQYERLGLDDRYFSILGLRVPLIEMPVAPGRSVANL
ncbi:MAG: HPr(Ser) kinase/phosphatase, partial [Vicinamibacterales bacterium]|nr:HPr(Ser) kinase/phosphatase [Vicinamibacterales bacterium]